MIYNDRGMKKWQGMILTEHRAQIKEGAYKQVPTMKEQTSPEQINQLLQDSFINGRRVDIQLNSLENGLHKDLSGVVGGFEDGLIYISTDKGLEIVEPGTIRHVSEPEFKKWYE